MSVCVGSKCPICLLKGKHCVVRSFQLNFKESLVNCEDPECSFPFGYDDSASLIIKKKSNKSVAGKENRVRTTDSVANCDSLDLDRILSQELRDEGCPQFLDTFTNHSNNDFGFSLDDCLNFIDDNPIVQSASKIQDSLGPDTGFDNIPSSKSKEEIDITDNSNTNQLPVNIVTNHAVSCLSTSEKLLSKVEHDDFQIVFINDKTSDINVSATSESKLNIPVKTQTDNVVKIEILDSVSEKEVLKAGDRMLVVDNLPVTGDRLLKQSIYYALSSGRQQVVEKKRNVGEQQKRPRPIHALQF